MKRFVNVSRGTHDICVNDLSLQMKASVYGLTFRQLKRIIAASTLALMTKGLVWKPSDYPMLFQ